MNNEHSTGSTCQKERPYECLIDCSSPLLTVNSSKGRGPIDPFPTSTSRLAARLELLYSSKGSSMTGMSHNIKSTKEYVTH